MRFDLHGLALELDSNDTLVRERFAATFASRPLLDRVKEEATLYLQLDLRGTVTAAPDGAPVYAERDLIHYYLTPPMVVAHFPRYGQLRIDLERSMITGEIISAAITTYGVFEDLVAIGLSPLLRRRGKFLIHAFAAAHEGQAALLVGGIGAGKTTTGIALVRAGWQLLSNDSPLLDAATTNVLSYPGLLSAYPETLQRFPELHPLLPGTIERHKVTFSAESVYRDVWTESATPGVILFPHVEPVSEHDIKPLTPPETLRLLLPHAIERWDTEMIPQHLALLNQLVAKTPAYTLALAPDTASLPDLVRRLLTADR